MARGYDHTQGGYLHWIGVLGGVAALGGVFVAEAPLRWVLLAMAGFAFLIAASFARLRVYDDGDRLRARFGPLPVLGWSFPYDAISDVRAGKSKVIDGWGLHWVPRRGWTVNLWGFDCVELRVDGRPQRIGTDDPRRLAEFLRGRTGSLAYSATRGSG